jgi:S-formylglutathione hydrolase FrmB
MFKTVEISDPRFAFEGLRFVTVHSPALGQRVDLTLFVPESAAGRRDLPIVLLLHGVYGSHWAWALKGGAHRTAARLIAAGELPPVVLAMPSDGLWSDGSGYVPHATQNFERWIVEEVPAATHAAVPETSAASPLFVAGLSMGGFGALRLGGKYPRRFKAVSGHSSATHKDQFKQLVGDRLRDWSDAEDDRCVLHALRCNRAQLPAIRFDCGTEDFLIEPNRALHRGLTESGIEHCYEEFSGAHTWGYWENHLRDSLRFFAQHL